MDLIDVIGAEYGLQQDEWSCTSPVFGESGQLSVIGWSGYNGKAKHYLLFCKECAKDRELFGDGYFKSLKTNLSKGRLPCGCSRPYWSKDQYNTLCRRKAQELNYTFLGFVGQWSGQTTKIKMLCEKHGEWSSGDIHNLINGERGCPLCRADKLKMGSRKPDDVMIESFFASGAFHPETKFWRSDRVNSFGVKVYWYLYCPECNITVDSFCGNLRIGKRPCNCSSNIQRDAYINYVIDNGILVSIKFGISIRTGERVKAQNRLSKYSIETWAVYTFPDVASCKKAERECKQELECGVVLKRDMPDGWTETTWPYNLEKIIEIYERNGGILNE